MSLNILYLWFLSFTVLQFYILYFFRFYSTGFQSTTSNKQHWSPFSSFKHRAAPLHQQHLSYSTSALSQLQHHPPTFHHLQNRQKNIMSALPRPATAPASHQHLQGQGQSRPSDKDNFCLQQTFTLKYGSNISQKLSKCHLPPSKPLQLHRH